MQGDTKYGRVPAGVPAYVAATVDGVRKIAVSLPADAPSAWQSVAYRVILTGVLRDHADNGAALLDDQDFHDLRDLMRLAADSAEAVDGSLRDQTFEVVLAGLIDDWVQNWNTDGTAPKP
jgi:hypothetical protein